MLFLTTRAVLLEVGNHLAKPVYRSTYLAITRDLQRDPTVTIVPISDELFQEGIQFFEQRPDKDWGLVDCISFVVTQRREMTKALTTDAHFEQAGFTALLRE